MITKRRTATAAVVLPLLVAACAEEPAPGSGELSPTASSQPAPSSPEHSASTAPPTSTTGDTRTLEVTVADGQVFPPPAQVDLAVGETLRLVVTSDADSEVHAHGFEVEAPVPAGTPTALELPGTVPGVYEVELHDPDLLLLQVAVR